VKILYWDDNDAVLENITKKLEKLQHHVVTAKTITECKEALANREAPIDLFIADYSIDAENGMTFVMGAKAEDPELHVVVLSPAILRSEFNQLLMCGITVMKKPILIDQVVRPFLSPDKRRKKSGAGVTSPPLVPSSGKGLLAQSSEVAEQSPEAAKKKRKGFTSLFMRGEA